MEKRRPAPRFRREGEPPKLELTDDDIAILRLVYRHRFVRADDFYRYFPDRTPDRLSRRLTLLYRAKYLDRPRAQIDRYHAGGSQALVYGLESEGARYLKEKCGTPVGSTDWRSRNQSYRRENLEHTLAISSFMIALELAVRASGNLSLIPFEDILAKAPEETRQLPEPRRWPVQVRFNGMHNTVHVMPDAIFGLRLKSPNGQSMVQYIFLEVDRGTMTIVPSARVRESTAFLHRATLLRKFLAYAETWRQKLPHKHLGIASARVVFLTENEDRVATMRTAANDFIVRPLRVPEALFLFGNHGQDADPLRMELSMSGGQATTLIPAG